jgi:transcriptional regulator with XRE-family HTH domain
MLEVNRRKRVPPVCAKPLTWGEPEKLPTVYAKATPAFRQIMEEKGLTYRDLAKATGLSPSFLQKFAAGQTCISEDSWAKINKTRAFNPRGGWCTFENVDKRRERLKAKRGQKTPSVKPKKPKHVINTQVLRDALISTGMSAKSLSKKSGIPIATVYRLMRPIPRFTKARTLEAFAHALGLEMADLFSVVLEDTPLVEDTPQ